MAERLNVPIEPKPLSDFDTLFPPERDYSHHQEQFERWEREARALAQKWMAKGPTESAARIVEMESRAAEVGITWPRLTPVLFDAIARQTATPAPWLASLRAVSASPDLLRPFLHRLPELADEEADAAVRQCLDENKYLWLGIEVALTLPTVSASTVKLAIARADDAPGLLRTLALCENLSSERLREVLVTGSAAVAFAAALGEWQAAKQTNRAVHHPGVWREAILKSAELADVDDGTEFELGEIFKNRQPDLAYPWLQRLCTRPDNYLPYHLGNAAGHAKAALQPADRLAFIKQVPPIPLLSELTLGVVSSDLDTYRALLNRSDLAEFHLKPLEVYLSSPAWRSKAIVALDFGYSTDQIIDITGPRGWSWSGPRSEMWKKLKSEADIFLNDTDPRIAAIATELSRKYGLLLQERLEEERQEAIIGRRR